jgi:hypothetical protein
MAKTSKSPRTAKNTAKASNARPEVDRPNTTKVSQSPRANSKAANLIVLLRNKQGASLERLQKAGGWQAHSVRGFLSGTVKKRLGLPLRSIKTDKGERRYTIAEI